MRDILVIISWFTLIIGASVIVMGSGALSDFPEDRGIKLSILCGSGIVCLAFVGLFHGGVGA